MQSQPVEAGQRRWPIGKFGVATALLLASGLGVYLWRSQAATQPPPIQVAVSVPTVTALGYLEPRGRVIKLSAPSLAGGASRVEQLLVRQGDVVKAGQMIAILDSHDRLQAALAEAQEQVKVAQSNLAVVQAGAKRGEMNAQQAEIARLEAQRQGDSQAQTASIARLIAEVQNAQAETQRYQLLYEQGAISASVRDGKVLTAAIAQRNLQEAEVVRDRIQTTRLPELAAAKATLDRIAEVRPVDVDAAQAQVDRAIAAVQQAQAQLNLAAVRAPQSGVVLEVHTRPGELVAPAGIVEIGGTQQMTALLEVYETDIGKVKLGQSAKLFADSRSEPLLGAVSEIGVKVKRQNVVNSDTSGNIDARVVEVRVQLDAASIQQVAGLTNLQVTGEIQR